MTSVPHKIWKSDLTGDFFCLVCQERSTDEAGLYPLTCPGYTRPTTCPDSQCKILMTSHYESGHPGKSFNCWGKINEHRFVGDGFEHGNDISHCVYTPAKGQLRFFENKHDQNLMLQDLLELLARLGTRTFNLGWYFSKALNRLNIGAKIVEKTPDGLTFSLAAVLLEGEEEE